MKLTLIKSAAMQTGVAEYILIALTVLPMH